LTSGRQTREQKRQEIRDRAEADLFYFARLVLPHRVYGAIHEELFHFWTRQAALDNQLCLLPRDHQKSHCAAVYAAWVITKTPWITILYVSATADLAEKQLYAIKNILDSKVYTRFWPDMIHPDEGKREKWSAMEIAVDHPQRGLEGVRDPTVKAAGLTTNITGFHANHIFLDDIVVPLNAYTEDGRRKVVMMYSQLASIETTGAKTTVVGTRYHPKDIYATMQESMLDIYKKGELVNREPLYEIFQKVVEEEGEFLWPKTMRKDGRFFGFDENELAKKRAKYADRTQFFAQYYNNPNDPDNARINPKNFQWYDRKHISQENGYWFYKDRKLNVFAAIDFAFSLKKLADFTAIVVVGVDHANNYYILDIVRFKTNSIKKYFEEIMTLHNKWEFRKLRAEVTVAQEAIVKELKSSYIKPNGLVLSIDEYRPSRHEGTKEERINATLSPRYDNLQMWHYKGGNCQILEEELTMQNPPHDDVLDALTAAVDVAVSPSHRGQMGMKKSNVVYHSRFGGVR